MAGNPVMAGKPIMTTFFREVVINPDLKELLDIILRAASPDLPAVRNARRKIRAMSTPATAYVFASMTRSYLEERMRIGTEPRAFPVGGDLFLDALDADILSLGPTVIKDYYSSMMGCYQAGDCPAKAIQGAFYAIDLILRKLVDLRLSKNAPADTGDGLALSFQSHSSPDSQKDLTPYLDLARQCLNDAVNFLLNIGTSNVTPCFLDYVVERKARTQKLLDRWKAYHRDVPPNLDEEKYLEGAARTAEETAYASLIATIEEYRVRVRERKGLRPEGKSELEQTVHPLYNAAIMYVTQGNDDREAEAFDLAFRHYARAVALFTKIQDRTSTAKVFVERARAYIKSGEDPESLREELQKAVSLVIAHIRNLPRGTLPTVTDEMAIQFLRKKGYRIEAEAYAATLGAS
jgi:tetratricopeptide (TPR) repeat protein